jgi:hypothetical protein
MRRLTQLTTACVVAVLGLGAAQLHAQETNTTERTFMTFSHSVELPGVTLEAGTYEFRLADTQSRNVVQVFRKETREPLGQWTFVQAERPQVSNETVVMFKEAREGATPAIQYWYFPGERVGKEFLYPRGQAEQIASRTGQAVKTEQGTVTPPATASAAPADSPQASNEDRVGRDAPAPEPAERAEAPVAEPQPSLEARAEPAQQAEANPRPVGTSGSAAADQQPSSGAAQPAPATEPARELPNTASPLPIAGLIGLLSLIGAACVRAFRA